MQMFRSADEAGRWLGDRLETLRESVQQAAELRRLINEGAREVLIDIDADPNRFSQDAGDRLRRYTARVSQTALARLERDGFQMSVLERSSLRLLGQDAALALEVLREMVEVLRAHTEACSAEGTQRFGEGRQSFSEASQQIGRDMDAALGRWSQEGPGRHRDSRLPWRRRKAQLLRPTDDVTFRAEARKAVQRQMERLEKALREAGQGSVLLAMAKYYGDIVSALTRFIAIGENLQSRAPMMHLQAGQRLAGLRRQASEDAGVSHSADQLLLDDETLDALLDRLQVSAEQFLQQVDLDTEELARLHGEALEETVRAWVEAQLGGLASPSLAEALGGAPGDSARVRRRLLAFLAQGQPLMHFNDDLPLQFDHGLRGQNFVIAETTDPSLGREFREACHQMGLPDPHMEIIKPEREGVLSLRVVQFVAGLPVFAQVDRLMDMIDAHRQLMVVEEPRVVAGATDPSQLRDMRDSASLPPLLPQRIERAFRQERALREDPSQGMSIDEAIIYDTAARLGDSLAPGDSLASGDSLDPGDLDSTDIAGLLASRDGASTPSGADDEAADPGDTSTTDPGDTEADDDRAPSDDQSDGNGDQGDGGASTEPRTEREEVRDPADEVEAQADDGGDEGGQEVPSAKAG